jgi:uncharacterized damage-inducible protein DinB
MRYPIGKFQHDKDSTPEKRRGWIRDSAELPAQLHRALDGLSASQLDTPYREGGWTVRQLAAHLADSHMNAFIRFKLALTEDNPPVKAYDQNAWVLLADAAAADISFSLLIVDGLHARWSALLSSLAPEQFARTFLHPERGPLTLDHQLQMYVWHGKHHTAHVTALRERNGWR